MAELHTVLADLRAESADLDAIVAALDESGWATPTPAPGWTVAHQIAHLTWSDGCALLAATDPARFTAAMQRITGDPNTFVDAAAQDAARATPDELLERWRAGRDALATALAQAPVGTKLPWFGPPMSAPSMATARLMETWAHGQDIVDAVGVRREPTARLQHVVWLGVRTRDFAFRTRGLPVPAEPFRMELSAPDGTQWTSGPEEDSAQRVTGSALDFCLLATQRRHRSDTDLVASGPDADRWLDIAQAFAGPPGDGRVASTAASGSALR